MELLQTITPWIGLALCAMAVLQLALWSSQSLSLISQNKKQFELSLELLKKQIQASNPPQKTRTQPSDQGQGRWSGYRPFRVAKLVKETDTCTSVYLVPEDGKAIAAFHPGQHLTVKFQIPGETKPVIRCYSLSDEPSKSYYRISVKALPSPNDKPDLTPGRASSFINQQLVENTRIEAKAPSGHFVLDEATETPIILLAGGIGVTPMVSMVNHLVHQQSSRRIVMFYGASNTADHPFKAHFSKLAAEHDNFDVVYCYSQPTDQEIVGRDFHVDGFVSLDVLKKVLPSNQFQFYMCGPPKFMNSLYQGLLDWGTPESNIFFEAFGPASIGKVKNKTTAEIRAETEAVIKFAKSEVDAKWNSNSDSILELAEENEVTIQSGCRAGNCGTCATQILSGQVTYPDHDQVDCEPGQCLACIAKPKGNVELDA